MEKSVRPQTKYHGSQVVNIGTKDNIILQWILLKSQHEKY